MKLNPLTVRLWNETFPDNAVAGTMTKGALLENIGKVASGDLTPEKREIFVRILGDFPMSKTPVESGSGVSTLKAGGLTGVRSTELHGRFASKASEDEIRKYCSGNEPPYAAKVVKQPLLNTIAQFLDSIDQVPTTESAAQAYRDLSSAVPQGDAGAVLCLLQDMRPSLAAALGVAEVQAAGIDSTSAKGPSGERSAIGALFADHRDAPSLLGGESLRSVSSIGYHSPGQQLVTFLVDGPNGTREATCTVSDYSVRCYQQARREQEALANLEKMGVDPFRDDGSPDYWIPKYIADRLDSQSTRAKALEDLAEARAMELQAKRDAKSKDRAYVGMMLQYGTLFLNARTSNAVAEVLEGRQKARQFPGSLPPPPPRQQREVLPVWKHTALDIEQLIDQTRFDPAPDGSMEPRFGFFSPSQVGGPGPSAEARAMADTVDEYYQRLTRDVYAELLKAVKPTQVTDKASFRAAVNTAADGVFAHLKSNEPLAPQEVAFLTAMHRLSMLTFQSHSYDLFRDARAPSPAAALAFSLERHIEENGVES